MPPNQPTPAPVPIDPNDPQRYDFFLNSPPAPKQAKVPKVPGVKDPFLQRVAIVVGGGVLLLIVVIILASLIFGGKGSNGNLVNLAEQQNELVRISNEATSFVTQQPAKNLAISIELSLTTSQQQLLAYLKAHGQKVGSKQLLLTKSATTDQQLKNAQAASNYDAVYTQIMQQQLQTYLTAIKQDYNVTKNSAVQQLLRAEFQGGTLLQTQANAAASALQSQ